MKHVCGTYTLTPNIIFHIFFIYISLLNWYGSLTKDTIFLIDTKCAFLICKLGYSILTLFKKESIRNARDYIYHKSSTTINFFYVHLIFLQHFLCPFTPQNGRLSQIYSHDYFFLLLNASFSFKKMLLRLSLFFSPRNIIMLTVKSTPRGLVFTR